MNELSGSDEAHTKRDLTSVTLTLLLLEYRYFIGSSHKVESLGAQDILKLRHPEHRLSLIHKYVG